MEKLRNKKSALRLALAFFAIAGLAGGQAWATDHHSNDVADATGGSKVINTLTVATSDSYIGEYWLGNTIINDAITLSLGVVPPVCGPITFSGTTSTLELLSDLHLTSTNSFVFTAGSAQIVGGGNALYMGGDLNLTSGKTLNIMTNNLTIDGQGHTLALGLAGSAAILAIASGVQLTLKNMTLKLPSGGITWADATSKLVLDNVLVEMLESVSTSAAGLIDIQNFVLFRGYDRTFTFNLATANGLHILANSCLGFDIHTTLNYGPAVRSDLTMDDATSWLYMNGATLKAQGVQGLQLMKGTLILDNKVTMDNGTNTTAANGIILGDGSSATNDMNVEVLSGAQVEVLGYLHWNPSA